METFESVKTISRILKIIAITCGRGLIKFTSFDSCLVFFDFDILSMIKKKNIFLF